MTVHTEHDAVEIAAREIGENRSAWDAMTDEEHALYRQDARDVIAALTEAGYRLLPPGGETRVVGRRLEPYGSTTQDAVQRTTVWPDGSSYTTAWEPAS